MILEQICRYRAQICSFPYTKIKKCTLCAKKCTGVWKETSTFVS